MPFYCAKEMNLYKMPDGDITGIFDKVLKESRFSKLDSELSS